MRRSNYQIYDSLDELYDLYPFEIMDIKKVWRRFDFRGRRKYCTSTSEW